MRLCRRQEEKKLLHVLCTTRHIHALKPPSLNYHVLTIINVYAELIIFIRFNKLLHAKERAVTKFALL